MSATINYYGALFDEDTKITPAIARAANIAKTYGKALIAARTPVDTGKLKSSWQLRLEGGGLRIKNEAPYAGFVEFGTRKMAPRAMMTSSLPDIKAVFVGELYKEIGKKLGADLVSSFQPPSYSNAVSANPLYPEVGTRLQAPIKSGLSKRSKTTNRSFLFSPGQKDILSASQRAKIARARPNQKLR